MLYCKLQLRKYATKPIYLEICIEKYLYMQVPKMHFLMIKNCVQKNRPIRKDTYISMNIRSMTVDLHKDF